MVKRDFILQLLLTLTLVLLFILLRLFVFKPYTIREQDSNSYLTKGDYVVVAKTDQPNYGDFVLYMVDDRSYIGRIVGKSGDQVTSIEDILYLNQEAVEQNYLEELKKTYLDNPEHEAPFTDDFNLETITSPAVSTIPQDNYLILNDDRRNTADSREFGLIPLSKIKGVLTFKFYPLNEFGFLTVD